jgi:hypothetical protein
MQEYTIIVPTEKEKAQAEKDAETLIKKVRGKNVLHRQM